MWHPFSTLWAMMHDPGRESFWAAIAAFAGIGQVVVLIVTARFVWRYLKATEDLGKSTRDQVSETHKLVEAGQKQLQASWRQVEIANDQLEAQIRPAVVARVRPVPHGLEFINVGKGPAFDLRFSPTKRGSAGSSQVSDTAAFDDGIAFIEAGGNRVTSIRTQSVGVAGEAVLSGRSLQCQYTSLSGRIYWTVVDFDAASGNFVESTRFYWEPDIGR